MAIHKIKSETTEKTGLSPQKPKELNVFNSGNFRYLGREGTITLTSTTPVYKLIVRVEHNTDNRLFSRPGASVIADKYDEAESTGDEGTLVSNINSWNASGLYWSNGTNSIYFRRGVMLTSRYLTFVWTFRLLGSGPVTMSGAPDGRVAWKIVDQDTSGHQGGYGGGGAASSYYYMVDIQDLDVFGDETSFVYGTVQYATDNDYYKEPNTSMGDSA